MRGISVLSLSLFGIAYAWYFPGAAPHDYAKGAPIELKVNKMTSVHTQLPYNFYSLPFCKPEELTKDPENLGEFLRGDIVQNSLYKVNFQFNSPLTSIVEDGYQRRVPSALSESEIHPRASESFCEENSLFL